MMYTDAIAELICDRIADGESMRAICRDADMPDRRTVERWMKADPAFAALVAQAREEQAEYHHAEMDEIERNTLSGELDSRAANVVLANKRWRMEKLKPKVYGARIAQEISGGLDVRATTDPEQLRGEITELLSDPEVKQLLAQQQLIASVKR